MLVLNYKNKLIVWSVTQKIILTTTAFFLIKIISANYNTNVLGEWIFCTSVLNLVASLDFGIAAFILNKSITLVAKNNTCHLSIVEKSVFKILLIISCLIILSYILIQNSKFLSFISPELQKSFLYVVIIYSFSQIFTTAANFLYGIEKGHVLIIFQIIFSLLNFSLISLFSFCQRPVFELLLVLCLTSFLSGISATTFYFFAKNRKFGFIQVNKLDNIKVLKEILPYSISSLTTNIAYNCDAIIIGKNLNISKIPEFSLTQKIFSIPIIFISTIINSFWPTYTKNNLLGSFTKNSIDFTKNLKITVSLMCVLSLIALLFSKNLVFWLSSYQVVPTYWLIFTFFLYNIINSIAGNFACFLNGINLITFQAKVATPVAVCNIILSILLTKYLGIEGPIIASCLSSLILIMIYIRKINKLKKKCLI